MAVSRLCKGVCKLTTALLHRAAERMLEASTCSFDTPKFAAMSEVQYDIMDLGGLNLTSTDFGKGRTRTSRPQCPSIIVTRMMSCGR